MLLCLVKDFFPKSIFGERGSLGEVECFGNIQSLFVFVFVFVFVFSMYFDSHELSVERMGN